MNMLHMKKFQSLNKMTKKKLLDGCCTTLEFFLVKHIYIYIYILADTIFSNLTKNALKILK